MYGRRYNYDRLQFSRVMPFVVVDLENAIISISGKSLELRYPYSAFYSESRSPS